MKWRVQRKQAESSLKEQFSSREKELRPTQASFKVLRHKGIKCHQRKVVPWTARRPNQSLLKEINPEYSLEGLMLKLQHFGHWCKELTHWKRPSCWETLKAGEGDDRGWDGWMASLTQWTWVWANSRRQWRTGKPGMLQSTGSQRVRHDLDWTTTIL